MGKGKQSKHGKGSFDGNKGKPVKTVVSRGFVTIGSLIKPAVTASSSQSQHKGNSVQSVAPASTGRAWKLTHEKVDECVYHCILAEPQPLIVLCPDADVPALAAMLKNLYPPNESANATQVTSVNLKTQRAQAQKAFRKCIQPTRGLIVSGVECAMLSKSCLPNNVFCKTIVHVGPIPSAGELHRRTELAKVGVRPEDVNHIYLVDKSAAALASSQARGKAPTLVAYSIRKNWMPVLQARCSAARKLVVAMQAGNSVWGNEDKDLRRAGIADDNSKGRAGSSSAGKDRDKAAEEQKRALAGRVEGLRLKLKVTMGMPLPDVPGGGGDASKKQAGSLAVDAPAGTPVVAAADSHKARRTKMELLGMMHTPSEEERRMQAKTGRTLAATKWMDELPGTAVCGTCTESPIAWKGVRLGASIDPAAVQVRTIVEGFREFISQKVHRSNLPKREQEAAFVATLPNKVQKSLREGRITALGWRPSPFGDEEWGGKYGKCCAHNEVAMFYLRPFVPLEVLNTHVCSRSSPAPGNEGHDGCLEFLVAQCMFFKRHMHVWDDQYFHFIDATGKHEALEKGSLLTRSEQNVRILMAQARMWCIGSDVPHPVSTCVAAVDLVVSIGNGELIIPALGNILQNPLRIQRIIAFFVLGGKSLN